MQRATNRKNEHESNCVKNGNMGGRLTKQILKQNIR